MRILITGSRDWDDYDAIADAILDACDGLTADDVTIVHGDCPTGADRMSDHVGETYAFDREPHPADWTKHGKAAGPIRNQEMVDAGADICIGFLRPESRGTRDCLRRARAANIRVRVIHPDGSTSDTADSARNASVSDADASRVHPLTPAARHAVYIQFDDPATEPWYHPRAVVVDNGDGTLTVTPGEHQALEIPALIPDPRTTTEVPF